MAEKKKEQFNFGFGDDFNKSFEESMKSFASFDMSSFGSSGSKGLSSFDMPDFKGFDMKFDMPDMSSFDMKFDMPDMGSFTDMKFDMPDMSFSFGEEKKKEPEKTGLLQKLLELFGKKEPEPEAKKDPFAIDMSFDFAEFDRQFRFDMPDSDQFFSGIIPSEELKTEKLIEQEKKLAAKRERRIKAKAQRMARRSFLERTFIGGYYNWAAVWDLLEEERIINMQDKLAEQRNKRAFGIPEPRRIKKGHMAAIAAAIVFAVMIGLGMGDGGFSFANMALRLSGGSSAGDILSEPLSETGDQRTTITVPVLMYHHLAEKGDNDSTIAVRMFKEHIKALSEQGYTAILPDDLLRYTIRGAELPEKPVMITFDDGYLSNYEYAYPVLKEYNQKATIFVIGATIGNLEYYKDTDYRITPHFTEAQGREMVKSGLIMLQSHTYDMHQNKTYDGPGAITDLIPETSGLDYEEFKERLIADIKQERIALAKMGVDNVHAIAFPYGMSTDYVDAIMVAEGFDMTFATSAGDNIIRMGHGEDLFMLNRYKMNDTTDVSTLLTYVEHAGETGR